MNHAFLIGCDAASGTDSSQLQPIFCQIVPGIVRSQGVWWSICEPKPGVYDFTTLKNMLAFNIVANFKAMGNPPGPLVNCTQPLIIFNIHGLHVPVFYTNGTQQAYIIGECNFVVALLKYARSLYPALGKNPIDILEYTNEPFTNIYPGCKTWQDTAIFTAKLAIAVKQAILATDPIVLTAGPTLTVPYDDNFFGVFAANGGFGATDIGTYHANVETPDRPAKTKASFDKYKKDIPVIGDELYLTTAEATIRYVVESHEAGIWALMPTYFLGPGTNITDYGYWQNYPPGNPKPNGAAFLATMRAFQP